MPSNLAMTTNEPAATIWDAGQASGPKPPPDLRLLHYNDVYHIEYAPLPAKERVESLIILSGLVQRSLLAASLAFRPLSTNIDSVLVMQTSHLS
jgi:hypothetical protein